MALGSIWAKIDQSIKYEAMFFIKTQKNDKKFVQSNN
jgi:hypothetical protein